MPRVTLGIATYDRDTYLEAALRSSLAQDYRDFEVLGVIDRNASEAVNGSIDPTEKVVMSGILKGYSFDIVMEAVNNNSHP